MTIKIITPIDNSVIAQRELASSETLTQCVQASLSAGEYWREVPVEQRALICHKAIDYLCEHAEEIAKEITQQMGRPIQYTRGEINGLEERGRYMIDIAANELAELKIEEKPGFTRFISREPLGVVFTIAPWNYPYLTAINSIIPALMAGNTVILKHSAQTLLCAERLAEAFDYALAQDENKNLQGIFQYLHLDHKQTGELIKNPGINFISFTGSVSGGEIIEKSAAGLFKGLALELGGKDPAYVKEDANLQYAVENLVDGAFFNSGQSCCGIERIYVHKNMYKQFAEAFINCVKNYKLGNPLDKETTLGPMVNSKAADYVREQIKEAIEMGATACIDENQFKHSKAGTPYLAPQVLLDVNHHMSVMRDESFGPVVGIMSVENDEQAIELMNDSEYGLTASIWSRDEKAAIELGKKINTGTVYMNRCDYLDPALAWVGVKHSGRGCSLSALGYQQLTRPKSFHLKTKV